MLLSYRDAQFWKRFEARHWGPRVPTVLRQPFKAFPFPEALLLRALQRFAHGLEKGDERKTCLVSVGDREVAPRRPLRALFRQRSESLEDLEQACARVFANQAFGLMVTQMQAVDPGIWSAVTAFLHDARKWIDPPMPPAFLDLFYGNYSSSFTGLHKDTQDIIAFVIRGKKRMLAWPFDYFLSRVDGLVPADRYFNKRLPIDHRRYRKDALVLDAQAGDVLYWPSQYWHVSEVQDGGFSAMLSLGLHRPDAVVSARSESKSIFSGEVPRAIPRRDAARRLRWLTGFGFEMGGPVAQATKPERDALSKRVTVVKPESSVILWKRDPRHQRILVAANGNSLTLPHSQRLVSFLERLCQGESVAVVSHPPNRRKSAVSLFETGWSKHCVLSTRQRRSFCDERALLVDWLLRVHAVKN